MSKTEDLLKLIEKSIESEREPAEMISSEVKNLATSINDKLDELVDMTIITNKKLVGSIPKDNTNNITIGLGRVTRAVNDVERAILKEDTKETKDETKPVVDSIKSLEKAISSKKDILSTDPAKPIAVRLSDGEKWVEQMTQVIRQIGGGTGGGSRLQFKRTNGEEVQPTAVDYASDSTVKGVVVLNPDGTVISGGSSGGSVTQGTTPWIVAGAGTAGSAASGVVTVQGIASGTNVNVTAATTVTNADGVLNNSNMAMTSAARPLMVAPSVFNGTTWDRARGDATDGLLVNLGSNNDVGSTTATGSAVPANAFYVAARGASSNLIGLVTAGIATNSATNDNILATGAYLNNGSSWDRPRSIILGTDSTGTGIQAVGLTAQLDDTSPTTITENQFGNLRIAADRSLITTQRAVTPTQTTVAGSASSVSILAANASRKGATISNDSSAILYLKLGTTASATSYSIKMYQDDYYEVPYGYIGAIDGIWASATGNARITELT